VQDPDDEFAHIRGQKLTVDQAHILDEFRMNLQTFINICRARRITPVLMTQFSRVQANPDPKVLKAMQGFESISGIPVSEFVELYARFNQAIREVGQQNGVLVIDLAALIPQDKLYLYDVVHLNTRGSQLAAQLIKRASAALGAPVKDFSEGGGQGRPVLPIETTPSDYHPQPLTFFVPRNCSSQKAKCID